MAFERSWHKQYADGVPAEVDIEKITMPEVLTRTSQRFTGTVAYVYMGKKITYGELERLVNRFARALKDLGVKKGDKVGMILPNMPQVVIANLAAQRIGAVTSMNNPLYTERELAYQLDDSDAKLVVSLDLLLPRVEKIQPETKVETIVTCHINDYLPFPKKQLFPWVKKDMYRKITPKENVHQFLDLMARYTDTPVENEARWDDTAALIYTGGTTGVSKGAELTHANLSSVVQQFTAWFPDLNPGEESLMGVYPIFHSAGYSVSQNLVIWNGWSCVLVPRPEPAVIIEMLEKFRPSFLPGVPTIYTGLLQNERFRNMDLSFVKGYFAGAAPLATDTIEQLKKLHGASINDVYGSTENSAFGTCTPWKGTVKPGTVGVPIPNTDMKVMDIETGEKELAPGEEGEICIKGPQVMKGYYKKPEETAAALKEGWFYLGDIGVIDENGFLSVVDRKKDMIVASGYNIYPNEIDDILYTHPKILEACTIGVPDEYRGETVRAFIVPAPGEDLTEEEIIAHCKASLAPYKVPKIITFVDELPKSAVGKILRRELREMALKET